MRTLIRTLWPFGVRYETRMLNRDAAYVIEDAVERFGEERLTEMANLVRTYLTSAEEQLSKTHLGLDNVVPHYRNLHRTARRERQDMGLSAVTLVLIHLQARKHGDACENAMVSIHAFVEEWASPDEDDAPTGVSGRFEA